MKIDKIKHAVHIFRGFEYLIRMFGLFKQLKDYLVAPEHLLQFLCQLDRMLNWYDRILGAVL